MVAAFFMGHVKFGAGTKLFTVFIFLITKNVPIFACYNTILSN